MEKQKNNLYKVFTGIAFITLLLMILSYKEEEKSIHDNHASHTKIIPSEIDINTAILNKQDLLKSTSPLISACLFGITESFCHFIGTNYNFK